jgi:formamidopyrimidine-DNA glycosylase
MPELPEVTALAAFLTERTAGSAVERADVVAFPALKTFDPPIAALAGRTVRGAGHRGKFVIVDCDGLNLVFHLARAGWLTWYDRAPEARGRPGRGPLALRVRLAGGAGWDLTEAGTLKRLAVYLVPDPAQVPAIARLGPEALDPALDVAALTALLIGHRARLKNLLTDQGIVAGIGNAYSDEILHTARLSPFKLAATLTPPEFERLYAAMRGVLTEAVDRLTGRPPDELKDEKREGLRVHRRAGQACPVCGDTIREISLADSAFQYCPTCQTGGRILADRRMSKLLR